jgi:hypothetical protein
MKVCLVIASVLIPFSCFAKQKVENHGGSAQEVTYCDLMRNPSSFTGRRIRVRAVYTYMFELSRLKPPVCCAKSDVPIWVEFSDQMKGNSRKLFHRFPKGMGFVLATFEGTFEGDGPYGDGGYRFKFAVDGIANLERKTNPRPPYRPEWVPDCEASREGGAG